jgi:uncharacterized protein
MKIKPGTQLEITEDLLKLERGGDELLLANYLDLRPLYIKKGREYIINYLKSVSKLRTYKKIINAFPHEIDLLDTLLDHGIIVPHGFTPNNPQKSNLTKIDLENKTGMSLYLLISQSCNMGCVYCLNGAQTYQTYKNLKMTREIAFKSIEKCLNVILSKGYLEIIFFGGEPLLNWPLAKEIITHCETVFKEKHPDKLFKYHFTSNLSFLPNDLIEWAKKYNISFLCDVDGPEKIHNVCRPFKDGRPTHGIIIRNIQRLLMAGLKVDVRATVTASNQDYLLDIAEHHKSIGVKSCAFIPVNPVNSDEDILDERLLPAPQRIITGLTKVYKSKVWKVEELFPFNQYVSRLGPGVKLVVGCGAPYGNTAVVDGDGGVYPCIYLVGLKKFCLGNINDESYPKKALIRWMFDYLHVDHREDCKSCPWRYLCGGGCPLGRLTVLNNPKATAKVIDYCQQIACDYTKNILELLLWDQARESSATLLKNRRVSEPVDVLSTARC